MTELRRRPRTSRVTTIGCSLLLLALSGFSLMCSGLMSLMMFAENPGTFIAATFLATVFTVPHVALVLWLDRNEAEPPMLLAAAFCWGALGATAMSVVGNGVAGAFFLSLTSDPAVAEQLTASFSAPLFEETTKAIALAALFLLFLDELDNVLDGVIYGALVGLGFAWFENILYYVMAGEEGAGAMLVTTFIRGALNGLGSHATFTGLVGLGVGLFRVMRRGGLRWLMPPLFLALAMLVHFAWNTFAQLFMAGFDEGPAQLLIGLPLAVLVLQAPFMVLIAIVIGLSWRHEDELVRKYLTEEPDDVAPGDEIKLLVPARRRMMEGLRHMRARGVGAWWRYRALANDQISLAFLRWHHDRDDHVDWPPSQDAEIVGLRERIRKRRAQFRFT